jgi:hypothetical protein
MTNTYNKAADEVHEMWPNSYMQISHLPEDKFSDEQIARLNTVELQQTKFMGNLTPRMQGTFSEADNVHYKFGGGPIVRPMEHIHRELREAIGCLDSNFLVQNLYRDGNDSVSRHTDKGKGVDPDFPIYSVSFGATRTFMIYENKALLACTSRTMTRPIKLRLKHRDVIIMSGEFQEWFEHSVPKEEADGPRTNVTFRTYLPPPPKVSRKRKDA